VWIYVINDTVPYPGPGDIGYTASAICLVRGIYLLRRALLNNPRQQRTMMFIVAMSLIVINSVITFWARMGKVDLKGDPLKLLIDIGYPTLDAIAIGLLAQIISSNSFQNMGGQIQRMLYFIAVGTVTLYCSDVLFGATTSLPTTHPWVYYNGSWADRLFTTAFWIQGIGVSLIPLWYRSRATET
jgi:hypothetical protein